MESCIVDHAVTRKVTNIWLSTSPSLSGLSCTEGLAWDGGSGRWDIKAFVVIALYLSLLSLPTKQQERLPLGSGIWGAEPSSEASGEGTWMLTKTTSLKIRRVMNTKAQTDQKESLQLLSSLLN